MLEAAHLSRTVCQLKPEIVIHTQALSDVDRCELEPEAARKQNVQATANLIEALRPLGALLIHVSTDYVFDGTKGSPYDEEDCPNPLSVYGRSKLEAERLVLNYPRSVVVRPSTLFGSGRMNFCDQIVSQLSAGQAVEAFTDQVTSPTYTEDLADAIAELGATLPRLRREASLSSLDLTLPRIYHITNSGCCTRLVFARRVAEILECAPDLILGVPMAHQKRPALRPAYAALATIHLARVIGRTLRPWDDALQDYLRQR
jgi:dTDP-4-dehydrorhamnose reductase